MALSPVVWGGMEPVSVAVVGLGFGRWHVTALEELTGRARLVAVVDPVPPAQNPSLDAAPQRDAILAARHYESLTALLADQVPDIVAIATPIHTHLGLAREALAAGANVLLEKPPTATMAEFDQLLAAAEEAGRVVQVGFQARGGGGIAAVREAIAMGQIGRVEGIGVSGAWVRDRAYYARARWAGRRTLDGNTVMDGVATNPLAHSIDAALAVDGSFATHDVSQVRIDAWHAHDIEADDTTSMVITTAKGTDISVGLTLCTTREVEAGVRARVTVHGSEGSLELFYLEDEVTHRGAGGEVISEHSYPRIGILANLVDHLLDGADLLVPLASTGSFMRVLEAARTGVPPRQIGADFITWRGEGLAAHPEVVDIAQWCARVAAEGKTFTELGAPWTH